VLKELLREKENITASHQSSKKREKSLLRRNASAETKRGVENPVPKGGKGFKKPSRTVERGGREEDQKKKLSCTRRKWGKRGDVNKRSQTVKVEGDKSAWVIFPEKEKEGAPSARLSGSERSLSAVMRQRGGKRLSKPMREQTDFGCKEKKRFCKAKEKGGKKGTFASRPKEETASALLRGKITAAP